MKLCCKRIWTDIWHNRHCSRKAVVERNGLPYCRIHDPEYIRAKEAKKQAKYDANNCRGCGFHFRYRFEAYCCICGTKRIEMTE